MTTKQQIHKALKGISSEYFPLWDETLGYERGLPHFRQLPQFSEEGVLIPIAGGYAYQLLHRRMAPATSQLSLTMQVEVEDDSSAWTVLPPLRNEHEIGDPSYPTLSAWASAQSNSSSEASSFVVYIPPNPLHPHDAFYEDWYTSSIYGNLAEQSAIEEVPPSMDTASSSTGIPRNMQWDLTDPYGQA